jgi:hypothetical protein
MIAVDTMAYLFTSCVVQSILTAVDECNSSCIIALCHIAATLHLKSKLHNLTRPITRVMYTAVV